MRHPERVSHLVLYGGFARGRLERKLTPQQREEAHTMIKLAELGWGKDNPAFRQFFTTQFIPDGTAEQHQWFNQLERISTSPQNAVRIFHVFYRIDVTALAPLVACPTLVLHSSSMSLRGDAGSRKCAPSYPRHPVGQTRWGISAVRRSNCLAWS